MTKTMAISTSVKPALRLRLNAYSAGGFHVDLLFGAGVNGARDTLLCGDDSTDCCGEDDGSTGDGEGFSISVYAF